MKENDHTNEAFNSFIEKGITNNKRQQRRWRQTTTTWKSEKG